MPLRGSLLHLHLPKITARCDDFHTAWNKDSNLVSSRFLFVPQTRIRVGNPSRYLAVEQQEDWLPQKANENICVNCSGWVLRSRAQWFISIWQRNHSAETVPHAIRPERGASIKYAAHLQIIPIVINEQSTSNCGGTKFNFRVNIKRRRPIIDMTTTQDVWCIICLAPQVIPVRAESNVIICGITGISCWFMITSSVEMMWDYSVLSHRWPLETLFFHSSGASCVSQGYGQFPQGCY